MAGPRQLTGLKAFSVLWVGQVLSAVGTRMTNFVLAIWVWRETGQASALALLTFCAFGATVVCSPFAGVLIDRLSRRLTIMLSDVGSAVATGVMLLLFLGGHVQLWQLVITNTVTGAFLAFQFPAYASTVADLLPKEQYARANGMLSLVRSLPAIAAPALAGVLLGLFPINAVLLVDVLSYLVAIGTVFLVRLPSKPARDGEKVASWWREWTAGFRYIAHRRGLTGLLALNTVVGLTSSMGFVVLIPMILARTGDDQLQLGVVQSVGAVGGVCGALVLTRLRAPAAKMPFVIGGILAFSLLGQIAVGLGTTLIVWAAAWFFAWLTVPFVEGYSQAIWQRKVPAGVRGRVFAATQLFENLALPIGFAIAGPLADHYLTPGMRPGGGLAAVFGPLVGTGQGAGMALIFLLAGTIGAVCAVAAAFTRSVRELETDLPDHDDSAQPADLSR
ncbi:MFS transporter [Amycolatopsis sp. H20-H5]|uniref:MFS transporter n=1 Tax=Amycolatopsis sp. H20-H5 TaxID=3046309 RepID=UPI002DBF4A4E|nr:MFS transporter [Amycolatopsis sp. H20-H5]MEC3978259.1 MFS transporter [Amycolatopsis sp. H20-H5]